MMKVWIARRIDAAADSMDDLIAWCERYWSSYWFRAGFMLFLSLVVAPICVGIISLGLMALVWVCTSEIAAALVAMIGLPLWFAWWVGPKHHNTGD